MTEKLIDAMDSLIALMTEESEQLSRRPWLPELPEIVSAKLRLTGLVDAEVARLKRESESWADTLDPEMRERLADASLRLRDTSERNAEVLARQIELSVDMMAAIAAEAQRLTGARSETYGASGGRLGREAPAPISINARL